jgi:L-arabinose transport system substrate-binding protein
MWLNSENHGATAVELLLASIEDGAQLPTTTYTEPEYISPENFDEYEPRLCS